MRRSLTFAGLFLAWLSFGFEARADDSPFDRKSDVIYGRKYGTALTMDVFTPKKGANGASVVLLVSGGYFSSHEAISPVFLLPLINRGYTVFAVVHGSQPRYNVSEIILDVNRAIRFIRHHAKDYAVDPQRIGVTGASAGGHLSLVLGTMGQEGDPDAKDPVDRESSRVQAVACFFPPTDFLNYGKEGLEMIHAKDFGAMFRPAFDYHELNKAENLWVPITDDNKLRAIARKNSPAWHVSLDDAPTLIYHGDADTLVPLQQSESIVEKLKTAKVDAKLVVKQGAGHGWLTMVQDMSAFADWFDTHLKAKDAK
jgi:acetyl esterase/lipase